MNSNLRQKRTSQVVTSSSLFDSALTRNCPRKVKMKFFLMPLIMELNKQQHTTANGQLYFEGVVGLRQ